MKKSARGRCFKCSRGNVVGSVFCERFHRARGERQKGSRICGCGHEEADHEETATMEVKTETKKGAGILRLERAMDELKDALIAVLTGHATVSMTRVEEKSKTVPKILDGHQPVKATKDVLNLSVEGIPKGATKILTAIAQDCSPTGATRAQISVLTGYKERSIDTYLQVLRQAGYIERGTLQATDAGYTALGSSFTHLPIGDALRAYWMNKLSGGEKRLFEVIVSVYPASIDRERICEMTDYAERSVDTYLQLLSARKLIVKVGRDRRASDDLFTTKRKTA